MTLDELQKRPDFVADLAPQQKTWVLAFCSNGADKEAATRTAYPKMKEGSVTAQADRNARLPKIRKIVDAFYGRVDDVLSKKDLAVIASKRLIECKDEKIQLGWANILISLQGYKADKPAPDDDPEDPTSIEDLVREMESKK